MTTPPLTGPATPPLPADPRRTEAVHPGHPDLDRLGVDALVQALVDDQHAALAAVKAAAPALARAVEAALPRLQAGGRLLYLGAGTSGRLGILDASELPPTFSWPPERAVGLIAGGDGAIRRATEGAEDDPARGEADVVGAGVGTGDVALLLAASGTTPYVLGAARGARAAGALTVGLANNPGAPLLAAVDCPVLLDTGPEVISGSTRLKAGTAQKIALNTLSSALMVRLGKVYGNLMVDLRASNAKLEARALALTCHATGAGEAEARAALAGAGGHVKTAVVMLRLGVDAPEARARLEAANGHARLALGEE
ncbi:N-acetylmuramic acid 6-phosphate etherase [Deinococcus sp. NW-56]|uniref:N-acetylmuramic acid 6-phosphate etherase n=1 Tax=Deinococcus sp. NW-56 TaxID=2080419 RepID=UPI000CF4B068|nr:N-acetylmuramic acid 6-phosphate etherase [Deinococcus sp. NW-56]